MTSVDRKIGYGQEPNVSLGVRGSGINVSKESSKHYKPKPLPKPLKVTNTRK